MKNLISSLLAAVLTVALTLTVGATEITNGNGGVTSVIYEVAPTYTVTIPSGVVDDSATVEIDAAPVLKESERVVVYIGASANYDNGFRLKEAQNDVYIEYTISDGVRSFALGDVILEQVAASPEKASVKLIFTCDDPVFSGNYSDTLTFIITVEDTVTE